MESTWETYDIPVLEAAIRHAEEHGAPPGANGGQIAEITGLSIEDVGRTLSRLDGEYLEVRKSMGPGPIRWRADRVYPAARRAVGQWPADDAWGLRLAAALEQAAEDEPDPVKKGKLRTAAGAVKSLGGQVVSGVITAYITQVTGAG